MLAFRSLVPEPANPDSDERQTNKQTRVNITQVRKFEDDEITEVRTYFDRLGFRTQLGLMGKE